MAKSSVMVSLPQMVDLALNCPEVGAVNFNILHSLLHVIIQQIELLECKVEFKGGDAERVQNLIATAKPGPSLNLTEYIITPGKDQRKVIAKKNRLRRIRADSKKGSKEEVVVERELKVIDQRKDSKEEPMGSPSPMEGSCVSLQTVVVVEPTKDGDAAPHVSVALSRVHFDSLEDEIEKLKDEIKSLKELPANMGLIDALRNASVDKSSPVVDMFQILTMSKRIDATETGISKLASILEDVAKTGLAAAAPAMVPVAAAPAAASAPVAAPVAASAPAGGTTVMGKSYSADLTELNKRLQKLEKTLDGGALQELVQKASNATKSEAPSVVASSAPSDGGSGVGGGGGGEDVEKKFKEYTDQLVTLDNNFNTQMCMLQNQFNELEKEIGEICERINAGFPGGDTGGNDANFAELYNKMNQMQSEIDRITDLASKLMGDKDERQKHMDGLLEQVELLKTIKANREELEGALADKADTCAVNRKVSHDQFDAACDDLSRGIEDALTKLTHQEQLWQQALDDIQREIESKLDKMELAPLRDFVHNKLKMLQQRLKALSSLKQETEAAGTKSKLLRDVKCLSCDKDVVMKKQMDPTSMPPPPALPPSKSMGPYLAYELDALRKQQKCGPNARNMNHFENAMAGGKGKGEDHICNRYCGGSHTVTTPQQRVARLGHFLQQWGPETDPVQEGQIRGTDGQMYYAREGGDIGRGRFSKEEDEMSHTNMKSRPSMVVHGGILSQRGGMPEEEKPKEEVVAAKRSSKDIQQSSTARTSGDAGGKRPSKTGRSSQVRTSQSHISFKVPEEAAAAPGPPPTQESPPEETPAEAAPAAAEGEAPADASGDEGGEGEAPGDEGAEA